MAEDEEDYSGHDIPKEKFRPSSNLHHYSTGADALMLIRYLLKSEIERSYPSLPLSEALLINITHQYWKKLSPQDRQIVQQKAQRNFYCFPSPSQIETPQLPTNIHLLSTKSSHDHVIWPSSHSSLRDLTSSNKTRTLPSSRHISKDIPVLYSNKLDNERHHLKKRIVAAQLSKQFTPIPVDDPHITLHHPSTESLELVNARYLQQCQHLKDYSGFKTEEEIQQALQFYRNTLKWRGKIVGEERVLGEEMEENAAISSTSSRRRRLTRKRRKTSIKDDEEDDEEWREEESCKGEVHERKRK